jgi:hypothetical protein
MIGPGWLPTRPRSFGVRLRQRTLPYTRTRRRRTRGAAHGANAVNNDVMLFDGVRELPTATVRKAPDMRVGLLLGDLQRWLAARWSWFKPRTVPVLVAALGALAVVHSVNYLSHPPLVASAPTLTLETAHAPTPIRLVSLDAR